ncbi:MAG: hypothetical protein ACLTJG_20980 [[Clostridium] innocuum]
MKKLMVLMLSLLLCVCSTSENKEKETPKEDPKMKIQRYPLSESEII